MVTVENDLESLHGARSKRNITVPRDPWAGGIENKVNVEYIIINNAEFSGHKPISFRGIEKQIGMTHLVMKNKNNNILLRNRCRDGHNMGTTTKTSLHGQTKKNQSNGTRL